MDSLASSTGQEMTLPGSSIVKSNINDSVEGSKDENTNKNMIEIDDNDYVEEQVLGAKIKTLDNSFKVLKKNLSSERTEKKKKEKNRKDSKIKQNGDSSKNTSSIKKSTSNNPENLNDLIQLKPKTHRSFVDSTPNDIVTAKSARQYK